MNDFISSIAEKIHTEQVDIQTKRLFKRYAARKQEDMERRKQVWIQQIYNIKFTLKFQQSHSSTVEANWVDGASS